MISERKAWLRRSEALLVVFVLGAVAAAWQVRAGRLPAAQVESRLLWILLADAYFGGLWLALFQEFAALRHGPGSEAAGGHRPSFADLRFLQRWCPAPIQATYVLAAAGFLYVIAFVGPVRWSSHRPFTALDAIGFLLLSSAFALLIWPTLASASRMPGRYADWLAPRRDAPHPG